MVQVKKALATNEQDNFKLLSAIKERLDRVGLEMPKVEMRFENLLRTFKLDQGHYLFCHFTGLSYCQAKRGGFRDTLPDDLLAPVLKALLEKTSLDPREVGDIVVGTVLAAGSQRATECRMAAFYAGFPDLDLDTRIASSEIQIFLSIFGVAADVVLGKEGSMVFTGHCIAILRQEVHRSTT